MGKFIIGAEATIIGNGHTISLPSFARQIFAERVIFEKIIFEEQQALKITAYKTYLEIIERLENLRNNSKSLEDYKKYTFEIEKICYILREIYKVDNQNRVTLPECIKGIWNIGDTLSCDGLGESLLIRKK